MESYDKLINLVESATDDIQKAEGGNKAAGTRIRKIMQEVKQAAQDVRVAILEARDDESSSGSDSSKPTPGFGQSGPGSSPPQA